MKRGRGKRSGPSTELNHQAHPRGQFMLAQVALRERGEGRRLEPAPGGGQFAPARNPFLSTFPMPGIIIAPSWSLTCPPP